MEDDKIIRKYYPSLKDKKEMDILVCVAETMKDHSWSVADAPQVQTLMTGLVEGPYGYYLADPAPSGNLLPLEEYKQILSHLISTKVLQQKTLPTKYGAPSGEYIKNDEYLLFSNDDLTKEILRNM